MAWSDARFSSGSGLDYSGGLDTAGDQMKRTLQGFLGSANTANLMNSIGLVGDFFGMNGSHGPELMKYNTAPDSVMQGMDEFMKTFGPLLQDQAKGFTKQNAIGDAQSLLSGIFRQYQETALPKIYGGMAQAGAYNSTSHQMMANDAFARTVDLGAQTILKNILDYNNAMATDVGSAANLINSGKGLIGAQMADAYKGQGKSGDMLNAAISIGSKLMGAF